MLSKCRFTLSIFSKSSEQMCFFASYLKRFCYLFLKISSLLIHIKHSLNSLVPRNFHLKSLTPSKAFRNSQFITIFSFILFHISVCTYMFLHLLLRCSQRAASSFWSFTQNLKLFKISQYLQEKICVGDFFNKVEGLRSAILLKRDSNTGVSCEYW